MALTRLDLFNKTVAFYNSSVEFQDADWIRLWRNVDPEFVNSVHALSARELGAASEAGRTAIVNGVQLFASVALHDYAKTLQVERAQLASGRQSWDRLQRDAAEHGVECCMHELAAA